MHKMQKINYKSKKELKNYQDEIFHRTSNIPLYVHFLSCYNSDTALYPGDPRISLDCPGT
jgi:hypothetical protein